LELAESSFLLLYICARTPPQKKSEPEAIDNAAEEIRTEAIDSATEETRTEATDSPNSR
jgi:hypothetical protein